MQRIFDWIRHCPQCGTGHGSFTWLCTRCEVELNRKLKLKTRQIDRGIEHHYLFDWYVGDGLNPIVHSLKGGGHRSAVFQMLKFFQPTEPIEFLIYPQGRPKDHAWLIAEGARQIHGGFCIGLVPQSRRKQSLLSKSARRERAFKPIELPLKNPYFVDDIVTTGATLKAAYRALGQPSKMTVWSLFYRNPL